MTNDDQGNWFKISRFWYYLTMSIFLLNLLYFLWKKIYHVLSTCNKTNDKINCLLKPYWKFWILLYPPHLVPKLYFFRRFLARFKSHQKMFIITWKFHIYLEYIHNYLYSSLITFDSNFYFHSNFYTTTIGPWNMYDVMNADYRSGTVNSKSFVGKVLLWIKWKFELNNTL